MINVRELLARLGVVVAKQQGGRVHARCPHPDHEDRNPSWYMWADEGRRHGSHRCWSCGFRGGPQALVEAVLGCSGKEAQAWLHDSELSYNHLDVQLEVGLITKREAVQPPPWVQFADTWEAWPALAVRYLRDQRGVTLETVRRWGLGWAAKGTLAGRVWLPIRDVDGLLCTWQARTYVDDTLRYTTPDRVPVRTLFGAVHWPEPEDRRVVVVVEGPFDALAVDQATRLPVGGLIGNQPTPLQLAALATFADIVVLTDADSGGDHAAEVVAGVGRWARVHRARLPEGMDPGEAPAGLLRDILGPWKSSLTS